MSYFELSKATLRQLNDEQLEDLVFRLAEAEVTANGGQYREVRGSGSSNAPDGGAYILVSLEDNCSDPMLQDRHKAMKQVLESHPNRHAIHLDFYDCSRLHQWLRHHASVITWVRIWLETLWPLEPDASRS